MNRSKSVLNKNSKFEPSLLNEINKEEPSENVTQTKTDLPELKSLYGTKSPYSLKIQKIIDELSKIDPDSLMKQVDPTIDSTKTIKQIQKYYNNIKKEIGTYIKQERLEEELKKEISTIPKQIEMLVHPPKTSTAFFNEVKSNKEDSNANKSKDKDSLKENKPVIDYHYKLKNLESEIGHSYQKFNTIKSKNNKLLIQLEELRKENLFYVNRLSELKKELKEKEEHYNLTKAQVEERMNDEQEKEKLKEILQKQEVLTKKTEKMKDDILENNSDYIEKMAKNNYLDFQKKELEKLIKNLEQKRAKENEKFNKEINTELDKIKDYQKESKILKELDKEKMDNLEELFKEILETTKTQNSLQLIEYLSRSREENISFKSTVDSLHEYVDKLQEEVNTLEYIISFCEEQMKNNKTALGENDLKNLDDVNKASALYVKLQYHVIKVLYKQYTDKLFDLLKKYNVDIDDKYLFKSENINAFIEFTVDLQEKLKKIAEKIKVDSGNTTKNVFDFNKWNSKWDKISMAKDEVIREYNTTFGKGLKFSKKNIENLVDEYLEKDKKATIKK
jgi:hypothetical protein